MTIRSATIADVQAIVEMIANDKLGRLREDYRRPLPEKYFAAFENIALDPNQELVVIDQTLGRQFAQSADQRVSHCLTVSDLN